MAQVLEPQPSLSEYEQAKKEFAIICPRWYNAIFDGAPMPGEVHRCDAIDDPSICIVGEAWDGDGSYHCTQSHEWVMNMVRKTMPETFRNYCKECSCFADYFPDQVICVDEDKGTYKLSEEEHKQGEFETTLVDFVKHFKEKHTKK